MSEPIWRYLIALGSNVRHHRHGDPRGVLEAALDELDGSATRILVRAPVHTSAPLGPSNRRYANTAALIDSVLPPPDLLKLLKRTERSFGRRPARRWSARVLDLDIILWSGGCWRSPTLTLPHPCFRMRAFVLKPAHHIAPNWRDPGTGLTLHQLYTRLTRRPPLPKGTRLVRAHSSVGRATDF